ncbi:MAG TPA: hypothetical protein PKC39_14205 [Ferruginibacter sp.]|nr:hypothetical protein [Ferruginibacter sp.]HMP22107.1 hypothetical protein [Ferruginibacter sp.]
MKRLLLICSLFVFAVTASAQDVAKVELSKEKKAELKKMKEANLSASFEEAGLTNEQIKQARTAMEDATDKSNDLKANKKMSDEEKAEKKKAINDEKNAKLKEIMGDKYKPWNEIRKRQKAQEEAFASSGS